MKKRPASKEKLAFALGMRKKPTKAEKLLWEELQAWKYAHVHFQRQVVLFGYIADFYCPSQKLVIEVDGLSHDKESDDHRDKALARNRIKTIRFTNSQVFNNIKDVLESIGTAFRIRRVTRKIESKIRPLSTNPQRQQQQDFQTRKELPKKQTVPIDDDESCGNSGYVEKVSGCQRQVYASMEVAENTARALRNVDIIAKPERCGACHLIHLHEIRIQVAKTPPRVVRRG